MADVFLSYKQTERESGEKVADALVADGYSVWWDHNLIGGQDYRDKIEEELEKARCVVVLWSEASRKSRWVRDEAERGLNRNILVPVSLKDGLEPPLGYGGLQTICLAEWLEDGSKAHTASATDDRAPVLDELFEAVDRALHGSQEIPILESDQNTDHDRGDDSDQKLEALPEAGGDSGTDPTPYESSEADRRHEQRACPVEVDTDRETDRKYSPELGNESGPGSESERKSESDGEDGGRVSLVREMWSRLRSLEPRQLLTTKPGLGLVLGLVFLVNYLETELETRYPWSLSWQAGILESFRWFEGHLDFGLHDLAPDFAVRGSSIAYFLLFLILPLWLVVESWMRPKIAPLRVLSLSVGVNYALCLPFFILLPVQERWTDPESGAMLLSDREADWLIEAMRPFSGLDNCFPSFHTSLTVALILFGFVYQMRFRKSFAFLGLTIVLSTFVLGIHWLPDIIAGASVGVISVCVGRRLDLWIVSKERQRRGSESRETEEPMFDGNQKVKPRRALAAGLFFALLLVSWTAVAEEQMVFVGVDLGDDAAAADEKLLDYLREEGLRFVDGERQRSYKEVIGALRGLSGEAQTRDLLLARVTPYALVAAQLLGARVKVLATYTNASDDTTYRSSFVVNRDRFEEHFDEATMDNLLRYLKKDGPRIRFAFHNRLSTSSFFLPSIFFRSNGVYSSDGTGAADRKAIISHELKNLGSTDLVKAVAMGEFDVAAVWDGTKRKFGPGGELEQEYGGRVRFIEIDMDLPNDMLVAPASMDPERLERLERAIEGMGAATIGGEEFKSWTAMDSDDGKRANTALSALRVAADEQIYSSAVVKISADPGTEHLLGAVENAVHQMRGRYTLYDEALHQKHDVVWTLEKLHDDKGVTAIQLRSKIEYSDLEEQTIPISFDTQENLTARFEKAVRERLHGISYVWAYVQNPPTVLHNVGFIPEDSVGVLAVRRVESGRYDYKIVGDEEVRVPFVLADSRRIELDQDRFENEVSREIEFDPLGDLSYRVVIPRPNHERAFFKWITAVLVGLFVLAALGFAWDMREIVRDLQPPVIEAVE